MIITHNLSLISILKSTWKMDFYIVLTCVVAHLLHKVLIPNDVEIPGMLATLLGTALAFFIGFSNNQAYDRWWEARRIWGELVNDSRSWARNVTEYTNNEGFPGDINDVKKRMVLRHISFVYALKESLRNRPEGYYEKYLSNREIESTARESNLPNAILTLNAADLKMLYDTGMIDGFKFMQMNNYLTAFTDQMGKSERIKNTVFPTYYIFFTKLFIWVLVFFCTIIFSRTIGGWSIPLGWILGFVFHVTHQNGMTLMNPFEEIPASIPLSQISRTIEINLLQMLGEKNIPAPIEPIDEEYIL